MFVQNKQNMTQTEVVLVGINGFGRIGRAVLAAALNNPSIRVVAINDPYISAAYAGYLIEHDTTVGPMKCTVDVRKESIVVDGNLIAITQKSDPSSVPWSDNRAVYVLECTGVFSTQERASAHLAGGASRVIIATATSDVPTIVIGANIETFRSSMQVICAGSSTGAALAPLIRLVNERYGVEHCSFTCIHAVTSGNKSIDGTNSKDWRAARSSANIVPISCGGTKTLTKIFPHLNHKIVGSTYRVPVSVGCVVDVLFKLEKPVSKSALEAVLTSYASNNKLILETSAEELVSSDVVQSRAALVVDLKASAALDDLTHKLTLWFDNELGYARALLSLVDATNKIW